MIGRDLRYERTCIPVSTMSVYGEKDCPARLSSDPSIYREPFHCSQWHIDEGGLHRKSHCRLPARYA